MSVGSGIGIEAGFEGLSSVEAKTVLLELIVIDCVWLQSLCASKAVPSLSYGILRRLLRESIRVAWCPIAALTWKSRVALAG